MSAINSIEKMMKTLIRTHPNPTPIIQDLYDNSTDEREKEEIAVTAWSWGIKINEEEK